MDINAMKNVLIVAIMLKNVLFVEEMLLEMNLILIKKVWIKILEKKLKMKKIKNYSWLILEKTELKN